jgi:hypothetical protein
MKQDIGLIDLSDIESIGSDNADVVKELFEEARTLLTRRTVETVVANEKHRKESYTKKKKSTILPQMSLNQCQGKNYGRGRWQTDRE